jgi:hypothetical protein
MRKMFALCCVLFLVPAFAPPVRAQENAKTPETAKAPDAPAHFYHLQFDIQEMGADGKPTNSRSYSTIVTTDRSDRAAQFGAIRTGSRVPIITGAQHGASGDGKLDIQYQYLDVGVNIDTDNVHEIGHQLAMHLKTEVSSLAESTPATNPELSNDPVVRQNSWQASVVIPLAKPTVVFSSDALQGKGGMQVVVTATALSQ